MQTQMTDAKLLAEHIADVTQQLSSYSSLTGIDSVVAEHSNGLKLLSEKQAALSDTIAALSSQASDLAKQLSAISASCNNTGHLPLIPSQPDAQVRQLLLEELRKQQQQVVQQEVERLLAAKLPKHDLALAACGGSVVYHTQLAPGLPWLLRLRQAMHWVSQKQTAFVHPAADSILLSAKQLPGRCLPLQIGTFPAAVDIRLPGLMNISSITMHHPLASHGPQPTTALQKFVIEPYNATAVASVGQQPDIGSFSQQGSTELMFPSTAGSTRVRYPLASPAVADHLRLTVLSNHGHDSVVCLYRISVAGSPVDEGSFC